jgi:hypothetical protein
MGKTLRNWFLMDDIPNGYFAISSRKVKYQFSGPVMTIRRNGDDATQTFEFDGETLDTAAINTFIAAGGAPSTGDISEWYDQMNASNKLIQANQDWEPLYKENAINNKVGMESVTPITTLGKLSNNIDLNNSTPATIFSVVDIVGGQGSVGSQPFGTDDFLENNMCRPFLSGNNYFIQGRDNAGNLFSTPTITSITGKNIFILVMDGVDNIKVYRNGASSPEINYTVTNGFLNTLRNITLGSFGGFETEFLIFDAILNADNRNRVRDNINSYYSIY